MPALPMPYFRDPARRTAATLALSLAAVSGCASDLDRDSDEVKATDVAEPESVTSKAQSLSAACAMRETFASGPASLTVSGAPGAVDQRATLDDTNPVIPGGQRKVVLRIDAAQAGTASVTTQSELLMVRATNVPDTILELSYGASAFPPADRCGFGPMLGLDLTESRGLTLEFGAIFEPLTVDVIYYTSTPLDPTNPVFYARGKLSVEKYKYGTVAFVPSYDDAEFNWAKVEGMHLSFGLHDRVDLDTGLASFELLGIGAGCPASQGTGGQ